MMMQNNKFPPQEKLGQRLCLLPFKWVNTRQAANILSMILLASLSFSIHAGSIISDQSLATEIQGKWQFTQETLGIIENEAAKPKEEQERSSAFQSSRNHKVIHETQLEGSTMSDYSLQKKRATDHSSTQTKVTPARNVAIPERYENMQMTYYPKDVIVEMKH